MNINLFNQGKLSTVHLTFEINKKFYNLKTNKLIYYFLVPTDGLHKYTKYNLPLIYTNTRLKPNKALTFRKETQSVALKWY